MQIMSLRHGQEKFTFPLRSQVVPLIFDCGSPGVPMSGTSYEQTIKDTHTRLKGNVLNFWEVLAQAVALISPSMTAALIVPLMFGTAGVAGWLCYLFGTIMLLFVAFSLNEFSSRYTSAGSMYEYTVKGLGAKLGGLS